MSLWRQLTRGLHRLVDREAADRDIADEVEHFFAEAASSLEARGVSPEDAQRALRRELGTAFSVEEQVRSQGWEHTIETVIADFRHGARRLASNPGFTAVTTLTLALGIGASAAMFSAAKPTLLERLPYPEPDRLVTVWDHARDGSLLEVTFGTFRELTERSRSLGAAAAFGSWTPSLTGGGDAERLDGQRVSAAYFDVLGVAPAIGRHFTAADDRPNAPKVAILSDALWRRRFGGNAALLGHTITLDDEPHTIVGVMPRTFENVLSASTDVWRPLQYNSALPSLQGREWGHHLRMVARLGAGAEIDQAVSELDGIAQTASPEFARPPWAALSQGVVVSTLADDVMRGVKPALLAVLGAVAVLLLISAVNVTNLLLGRGSQRRPELALRMALGASRVRVVRQLLIESVVLALPGCAVGLAIAAAAVPALIALAPPGLPRAEAIDIDGAVLGFAFALSLVIAVAAGIVPALQSSHGSASEGLQRLRPGAGHQRTRRALVVAEVALAIVLLVAAGLLVRSLYNLFAVAPGFDPSHLITMQVQTSGRRLDKPTTHRFFTRALDAVHNVPGVTAAAFTSQLPLSAEVSEYGVSLESSADDKAQGGFPAFRYAVTPGYLETMRIPLRRGRVLERHDTAHAPPVVVISESLAKQLQIAEPIGQRIHIGPLDRPPYTIVGIVGDVRQISLSETRADAVYVTNEQWAFTDGALTLVARSAGEPAALATALRSAVTSVDSNQPISRVRTMDDLVLASMGVRRFALALFQAFSIVALILAGLGLYGVLSGSVNDRIREIGIRSAIGAAPGDILALVLRQGMILSGLGIAIGIAAAVVGTRAVESLLFEISRLDVATYFAVIALIVGVSAVAAGVPARRAASVDAAITLRSE